MWGEKAIWDSITLMDLGGGGVAGLLAARPILQRTERGDGGQSMLMEERAKDSQDILHESEQREGRGGGSEDVERRRKETRG